MPQRPIPRAALYVRLPVAQAERLDQAVNTLGMSKADLVASLISRYVDPGSAAGRKRLGEISTTPLRPVMVQPGELTPGLGVVVSNEPLEVLTPKQAADFLQIDENTLVRLADAGELPGKKLGKAWRFSRQALLDWLGAP